MTLSQAERSRMHLPPAVALDMYRRMHKIRQFDEIARALIYGLRGEVPEPEYLIPLGQADIKRAGSDVTDVAWAGFEEFDRYALWAEARRIIAVARARLGLAADGAMR